MSLRQWRSGESTPDPHGVTKRHWPKRILIVSVALIAVAAAALGYRQFAVADAAAPLELGDRSDGGSGATQAESLTVTGGAIAQTRRWVTTEASIVGYRVDEVVGGVLDETVAGRTNNIDGIVKIEDGQLLSADFTVDMTTEDAGLANPLSGSLAAVVLS